MPNLGFGLTTGGVPALRIAFDNSTDLVNEPASSVGKFQLDSLNGTKLSYIYNIYTQGFDSRYKQSGAYSGGGVYNWFFYNLDMNSPSVSSNQYDTCGAAIAWNASGSGSQYVFLYDTWYPFGYMPLIETRFIDTSLGTDTYEGATVNYDQFAVSGAGFVESYAAVDITTSITFTTADTYPFRPGTQIVTRNNGTNRSVRVSTFQLPMRNVALPNFSTTPTSGQQALLLNPTTARLALPGRDITDSNTDHYIFHEDKIPAKIMAAGDINVAASGTADIACPLPLTTNTYMDFMVRRQTDTEFFNPPYYDSISSDKSLKFKYFVDIANQKVTITNLKATAITIRYMILAKSEEEPTSGGGKVLYRGNDGTRDFVQIKRPGSSDLAPNLNDIIVDTRLAYVPILAEGFLNWTSDFPTVISGGDRFKGERMTTISVSNPSPKLKLFVKQIVVFDEQATPVVTRGNYHKVFTDAGSWTGRASGDSSWANIASTEDSVDFYMSGANPISSNSSGGVSFPSKMTGNSSSTSTVALGLRYYIFGIPSAL